MPVLIIDNIDPRAKGKSRDSTFLRQLSRLSLAVSDRHGWMSEDNHAERDQKGASVQSSPSSWRLNSPYEKSLIDVLSFHCVSL